MTHTRSKMTPDDGALDQKWQHVEGGGIRHGGLTLRLAHTSSKADGGGALGAYADSCDCEIQRDEPAAGLREGILFCPLHEAAGDLLTALEEVVGRLNRLGDADYLYRARATIAKARGQ